MLVAVFMAATSFCQQSKFKITYSHSPIAEWAKSPLFVDDTSMWVNASYALNAGGYGVLMLKIGMSGNILDHKECEKTNFSYLGFWAGTLFKIDSNYYTGCEIQYPDPTPASPGDMYAFPALIKYNLSGDTVWTRYLELDTSRLYRINSSRPTQDKGILLCGSKSTSIPGTHDFLLIKLDTAGNLLWLKTYGALNVNERASTVEELPNGKILLSGVKVNASLTAANPWVLILDDTGKIEWQHTYTRPALKGGGGYTKAAKTGGFFLQGMVDTLINAGDNPSCPYISRMESNGSFRWLKIFNNKWFTQIWDFYELDNGDVVFCGDKIDSANNTEYGYIAKIDSFGNLKWWRTFFEKPTGFHYLSCIRPAPDGGYVAVGSAVGVNTNSQDAWIIKTDSMGCVIANCFVGIDDIENLKAGLKVYPNPATNEVHVSVSTGLLGEGTVIAVYDMSGRRMVRIVPDGSRQKATINTKEWASGMYVISVQRANGDMTTAKITIVK